MKKCSKCSQEKELDDFPFKNKEQQKYGSWCKDCQKQYSLMHYENNVDKYKKKARINGKKLLDANKEYIISYLKSHPCIDCGESDLDVLEFDHIEMLRSRRGRVSHKMSYSLDSMIKEIEKCEVRCANCHSKRTRKQMGTSRYNSY